MGKLKDEDLIKINSGATKVFMFLLLEKTEKHNIKTITELLDSIDYNRQTYYRNLDKKIMSKENYDKLKKVAEDHNLKRWFSYVKAKESILDK